jgi:hypothetical protein
VRKNRSKAMKDSHTPQLMKLQLLFVPTLMMAVALDLTLRPKLPASIAVVAAFLVSTFPFALRAVKKDIVIGILSPAMLALRACAQFLGVVGGLVYARRKLVAVKTSSPA